MLLIALALAGPSQAQYHDPSRSFGLAWTATGDDTTSGRARWYDVRYRLGTELSERTWQLATVCPGAPLPSPAGLTDSMWVTGLLSGATYTFGLKVYDERGNVSGLSNVVTGTTAPGVDSSANSSNSSLAAWPNPARLGAIIQYGLARAEAEVRCEIFDLRGALVRSLFRAPAAAGVHHDLWDLRTDRGRPAPPGLYLIRLRLRSLTLTRRIVVLQ